MPPPPSRRIGQRGPAAAPRPFADPACGRRHAEPPLREAPTAAGAPRRGGYGPQGPAVAPPPLPPGPSRRSERGLPRGRRRRSRRGPLWQGRRGLRAAAGAAARLQVAPDQGDTRPAPAPGPPAPAARADLLRTAQPAASERRR